MRLRHVGFDGEDVEAHFSGEVFENAVLQWVASPSDTMRAWPTIFFRPAMSPKPRPAWGVSRRTAFRAIHSRTGSEAWAGACASAARQPVNKR